MGGAGPVGRPEATVLSSAGLAQHGTASEQAASGLHGKDVVLP